MLEKSQEQKFTTINSKESKDILEYLSHKLHNLTIEICNQKGQNILDLMKMGKLLGWCWETTASTIVFLNDDDYIERGNIKLDSQNNYDHSWICFKYNKKEYILDPCLNLLYPKELYKQLLKPAITGKTTAKEVRNFLIESIQNSKQKEGKEIDQRIENVLNHFFETHCPEEYKRQQEEIHIIGNEDINSPMYRNNTGYKAEIQNGKVKKLVAHYYDKE